MHLRRFKNKNQKHLLNLKGRFSLIHLGGGAFLYSFPGKHHPVVGKVEFWRKKYRQRGAGVLACTLFFFTIMSFLANAGQADSVSIEDLDNLEKGLSPIELVERSEEIRNRLLNGAAKGGKVPTKEIIEYTVKQGDTLSGIASRHSVPIEMITVSNQIRSSAILRPGRKLVLPHRKGLVYKFKKGDRLAAVAQHYSVKLNAIVEENPSLLDLDMITPGTRMFLPNAKIPAPPPSWFRPGWGRVTSRFGSRWHPVYRRRRMHRGIDIGMRYGTVRAARDGHVVYSGFMGSYGNVVIIEHNGGYKTLYAHLSRLLVRKGQYVKSKTRIAVSGNTGVSTGPHLHFELIRNGRAINPRRKIRF